jgi:four helix bundle protein
MTNDEAPMTNGRSEQAETRSLNFDLAERTATFGERVIRFVRKVRSDAITRVLISQLVRSGTSIGANYCEADDAGSRKEFRYRISICKREARETKYWLRMLVSATDQHREEARPIWQEADELHRIFAAIHRKTPSSS